MVLACHQKLFIKHPRACKILAESFAYKRALSSDEINYINSVIKEHREDIEIEEEK